jgi:hypothetical protein
VNKHSFSLLLPFLALSQKGLGVGFGFGPLRKAYQEGHYPKGITQIMVHIIRPLPKLTGTNDKQLVGCFKRKGPL